MSKWNSLFKYDEESPTGLLWDTDVYNCLGRKTPNGYKGEVAGVTTGHAAARVGVDYQSVLCHIVIWEMHEGSVPLGMFVDHIDRNESNNRIGNLRLVSRLTNNRNKGMYETNTSGCTGVKLIRNSWVAQWNVEANTRKSKSFSISRYGDLALKLACEYRARMIAELNLQGAGYTESHGVRNSH